MLVGAASVRIKTLAYLSLSSSDMALRTQVATGSGPRCMNQDHADLLVPRTYSSHLSALVRHGAPHMLALPSLSSFGYRERTEMHERPGPC